MLMSHVMVMEGHLNYYKEILVNRIPENVSEMPISFLLHEYQLNHGLVRCFSNRLEWVDSIQCDHDQRELSLSILDSNL